jgi:hypothetical protein
MDAGAFCLARGRFPRGTLLSASAGPQAEACAKSNAADSAAANASQSSCPWRSPSIRQRRRLLRDSGLLRHTAQMIRDRKNVLVAAA